MSDRTLIVKADGKKGFVAGLKWTPLVKYHKRGESKEIREHATAFFSKQYVMCASSDMANAGFYCYDDSLADDVRPEQLYSFASLLARNLPVDRNILVVWKVFLEFEETDLFVIIDINQGLPNAETICQDKDCQEKVQSYLKGDYGLSDYELYTNSIMEFPNGHEINAEAIFQRFDKKDKIEKVPVDYKPLIITLVSVVVLALGYSFYSDYQEEQERLARIEEEKKKDPKPKYISLLNNQISAIGISSFDMYRLLQELKSYPVVKNDWYLEKVSCLPEECLVYWTTGFGYQERLTSALVHHQEVATVNRTLNDKAYSFRNNIQLSGVAVPVDLIGKEDLKKFLIKEFEIWRNSQLKIKVEDIPKTWPDRFGEMPPEIAVQRYKVELSGQLEVVQSFLMRYPKNAYWEELGIDVKPLAGTVEYRLRGHFYGY